MRKMVTTNAGLQVERSLDRGVYVTLYISQMIYFTINVIFEKDLLCRPYQWHVINTVVLSHLCQSHF